MDGHVAVGLARLESDRGERRLVRRVGVVLSQSGHVPVGVAKLHHQCTEIVAVAQLGLGLIGCDPVTPAKFPQVVEIFLYAFLDGFRDAVFNFG